MSLAAPAGLVAAALVAPLVLWYVLRARRPRMEIGSVFLWQRTEHSVAAAVPWERFRPDWTFWLVLAAVLAGALALARPTTPVEATLGDHAVLIVDTSASMGADEQGPSRLELARREADDLLDGLGPGQRVSVVEAGERARIVVSATADPAAARRAVEGLSAGQGDADLSDAFTLAESLQRPGQDTVAYLLTDRAVPNEHAGTAPDDLRVRAVGTDRPNLAVSRLRTAPRAAGTTEVFAQVRNFSTVPARARLTLASGGRELASRQFRVAPREAEDVLVDVEAPPPDEGGPPVLTARVEPLGEDVTGEPAEDALAVDDTAYAVVRGRRQVTALVAGPGNVFVESGLSSLEGVEVEIAPRVPGDLDDVDLLVVDRVAGPAAPPVPTLLLDPERAPDGITMQGEQDRPAVTFQHPDHELLSHVDLSDLAVHAARPVEAPALTPLVRGPAGSLVVAGRLGGQPVVHVGFDVTASTLPLQVAWPVLLSNAVGWLAEPATTAPLAVGDQASFSVPPEATGVEVTSPTGETRRLDASRPRVTVEEVGVWRAGWLGPEEALADVADPPPVAVNAPPEAGDLVADGPAGQGGGEGDGGGDAARLQGREAHGPGVLALVAALLLAEWGWAHGLRPVRWARRARRERGQPGRGPRRGSRRGTTGQRRRGSLRIRRRAGARTTRARPRTTRAGP